MTELKNITLGELEEIYKPPSDKEMRKIISDILDDVVVELKKHSTKTNNRDFITGVIDVKTLFEIVLNKLEHLKTSYERLFVFSILISKGVLSDDVHMIFPLVSYSIVQGFKDGIKDYEDRNKSAIHWIDDNFDRIMSDNKATIYHCLLLELYLYEATICDEISKNDYYIGLYIRALHTLHITSVLDHALNCSTN